MNVMFADKIAFQAQTVLLDNATMGTMQLHQSGESLTGSSDLLKKFVPDMNFVISIMYLYLKKCQVLRSLKNFKMLYNNTAVA